MKRNLLLTLALAAALAHGQAILIRNATVMTVTKGDPSERERAYSEGQDRRHRQES
jgi:hypothetical protein